MRGFVVNREWSADDGGNVILILCYSSMGLGWRVTLGVEWSGRTDGQMASITKKRSK